MNVTLSVIHISFLWTYPNEYPSYVILVYLNLVSHSRSWKRSPGWLAPFFRQYWPKKLLTVSIVKENFPGISIQWWFLLWQANAPSLARGAVVLRSLRGATSLHGISGDNKALCGERVSPSWKEFRLCSRPELSSLTNVQLIVGGTQVLTKHSLNAFGLLTNPPRHRLTTSNWQVTCTLQGSVEKVGGIMCFSEN